MMRREAVWLVAVLAVVAVGVRLAPREHRLCGVRIKSGPMLLIHFDARPEGAAVRWQIRTGGPDRIVPPISREGRITRATWDDFASDMDRIGAWNFTTDRDPGVDDGGWTELELSDENATHSVVLSSPMTPPGRELESRLDDVARWPGCEVKAIRQEWRETLDRQFLKRNHESGSGSCPDPSKWRGEGRS